MEKQETLKNAFKNLELLSNIAKDNILLSIFMGMIHDQEQLLTFLENANETIESILNKFIQRHEVFKQFVKRIPSSMDLKEESQHIQIQEKKHYYLASYSKEMEETETFYTLYSKDGEKEIAFGTQIMEIDDENILLTNKGETTHIFRNEEGRFTAGTSFQHIVLQNAENLENGYVILRSTDGDFLYSVKEKKKKTPLFTTLKKENSSSNQDYFPLLVGTLHLSSTVENAPKEEKIFTMYMDMTATNISPLCDLSTSRTLCLKEAGWECDFKSLEIQKIKDELNHKAVAHQKDFDKKNEIRMLNQQKLMQYIKK